MVSDWQSSVLAVLCMPSNCAKRKMRTEKQLSFRLIMRWTTKEIKMQLQVLED